MNYRVRADNKELSCSKYGSNSEKTCSQVVKHLDTSLDLKTYGAVFAYAVMAAVIKSTEKSSIKITARVISLARSFRFFTMSLPPFKSQDYQMQFLQMP